VGAAQTVLDFDEWLECLARLGVSKYQSVKQLTKAAAVKGFLQNFFGEMSEEDVLREGTYIRATRFDWRNESKPLERETKEQHAAWLETYQQVELSGLYGFPTWEKEVHDLMQAQFAELASIFRSYCRSAGESASDAAVMSMDEFHDFVVDCGLETNNGQPYTFNDMKAQFSKADKSGKGQAGPPPNKELVLPEFLNLIVRVSFWRLNPEFGELTMEHQEELLPVPVTLDRLLKENILPRAHRDDAADFREKMMADAAVRAVIDAERDRLQAWYDKIPLDDSGKVGTIQWTQVLKSLNVLGTFSCARGSDVVGDDRIGTEFKCRLSEPQAKAAFVNSQKEGTGGTSIDVALDFDEMLECIARCGVDKYRAVSAHMDAAAACAGFIANILGDANEEQVITKHTYIHAERFDAAAAAGDGTDDDWLSTWDEIQLTSIYNFPLWEKAVHDLIKPNFAHLKSIFRAYAAGAAGGDAATMDMDEFHDFVIEADLITKEYGFDVMQGQFTKALDGGDDSVLELHEFLTMVIRIAFHRANPRYGINVSSGTSGKTQLDLEHVPLPEALETVLEAHIFPHCRRDDGAPFAETLMLPDVSAEIASKRRALDAWYEQTSEGRPGLELKQWLDACAEKLLFSDLRVLEHRCRFTEPQARVAFAASAAQKDLGLQPDELVECVARCAVDKYRGVEPMSKAQAVDGFLRNLFGEANEEEIIYQACGFGAPPESKLKRKPPSNKPRPKKEKAPPREEPPPIVEEVEEPADVVEEGEEGDE